MSTRSNFHFLYSKYIQYTGPYTKFEKRNSFKVKLEDLPRTGKYTEAMNYACIHGCTVRAKSDFYIRKNVCPSEAILLTPHIVREFEHKIKKRIKLHVGFCKGLIYMYKKILKRPSLCRASSKMHFVM